MCGLNDVGGCVEIRFTQSQIDHYNEQGYLLLEKRVPEDIIAAEDLLYQICVDVNPALEIHSVALPAEGQPEDFPVNNVGRYALSTAVDRTELKQGEAVRLTALIDTNHVGYVMPHRIHGVM